ncbi:hypothetical protein [Deinococcus sp.]|uniref:hypothetical protein n=1 Tax=Deinococcus sp. TaxID=47478 RepID=UPI003C7A2F62
MRVVQFLQVVVLLLLLAYGVLVYLENPVLLRLPLLFAGREAVLPAGLALSLGVLAGALYAALLILPRYLRQRLLRRSDMLRRRDAETRLQSTLQAVIDSSGRSEAVAESESTAQATASVQHPVTQGSAAQNPAAQNSAARA